MSSTDISLHNNVPIAHEEHDHDHDHHDQPFIFKYIFSQDHKVIAKQFLISGIIWAFIGGHCLVYSVYN
ncbi:Cytochrome-c oxidase [Adhaeribacter pallidiroseus]|uniref:Cytochrome-c oxidase n=1 Tax=Adhaeribacter pallidiroseus TaxID=2072847 RepID=A0A369QF90_9BACT|nr:Cytochrome-c oxidase [Adhaeribacter pallidiroseus]